MEQDLFRYEGERCKSLKCQLRNLLGTPGFLYVYLFRKVSNSKVLAIRWFWIILLHFWKLVTNIQIPLGTTIDKGFRILHFGNIVINPDAIIGRNFNIANGALIGASGGKCSGVPKIGNNVYIGANAIVIGGIRVGNDVLIAPGAFVNFDVPDNSIVIGNPGKIITKSTSPSAKYIVYPVEEYDNL